MRCSMIGSDRKSIMVARHTHAQLAHEEKIELLLEIDETERGTLPLAAATTAATAAPIFTLHSQIPIDTYQFHTLVPTLSFVCIYARFRSAPHTHAPSGRAHPSRAHPHTHKHISRLALRWAVLLYRARTRFQIQD